jgi:hypothetical protein
LRGVQGIRILIISGVELDLIVREENVRTVLMRRRSDALLSAEEMI